MVGYTPLHAGLGAMAAQQFDAIVFVLIGLFGGAHCLGMCGPLVNLYTGELQRQRGGDADTLSLYDVRQHGLFNAGRAVGYALVGAVFALVGAFFFDAFDELLTLSTGIRVATGLVVGAFIIATGVYYVGGKSAALHRVTPSPLAGVVGRVTGVMTDHAERFVAGPGIVVLGVFHGLLPCPLTYPAYLYAFAIGDPLRAAMLLGLLGIGTVPSLFLYGTLLQSLSVNQRVNLHRALGVVFIVLGYIPLSHGLMLLGLDVPHPNIPIYQPLG